MRLKFVSPGPEREAHMPLLLLADRSEQQVRSYLQQGILYVAQQNGEDVGIVLAVPTEARESAFRRIVLPITSAERTLDAVPPVLELAPLFHAQVFLVHVCEGESCSVQVPEMREAFDRLHGAGIDVDPVMKQGDAAAQILETSRETDADLIVMTTHGHSGLSRWVRGSIAEKVLRASRIPVLVVRTAKRSRLREPATL